MYRLILFIKKCLWLILFGISTIALGQKHVVTGHLYDENNLPMPAVTVLEKGTNNGTISDGEGNYSISLTSSKSTLLFSIIGYVTDSAYVGNRSNIDFKMLPSIENLSEVVVIGYGTQKKSDITTSLVSIKSDKLQSETQGNFTATLQGKASGVQVITNSGAPGAVPSILIRGFTTINSSTSPLYVVDGIPIVTTDGNSNVNFINSDEIESIEVLKDASAAAIYGTRASSGVILITTKRGKKGDTKYNFNLTYGIQDMQKPYNSMNSDQYVEAINLSYENSGLSDLITNTTNLNYTDWWSACTRNYSPELNASLNISGGNEKHKFNLSASYFKQESFYNYGKWERLTARMNNDLRLSDWITIGIDLNPRYENWDNTPSWYGDCLLIDPVTPIYIPDDELTGEENEYSIYERSYYTYVWNPKAREARADGNGGNSYALYSNAYADIKPFKNFVFRSQIGLNLVNETDKTFNPEFTIDVSHEYNSDTNLSRKKITNLAWTWQNTATYNINIDKHHGSIMAGVTAEEQKSDYVYAYAEGFPNTSEALRELSATNGTVTSVAGNSSNASIASYLGRLTYNYDNRYLLTTTVRRDGSSKFMDNNKWAIFPSASAAWRFTNEKFIRRNSILSDGKIFIGWGAVGNQGIPDDVYLSTLYTDYTVFGENGTTSSVTMLSSQKNEDIKWEKVEEQNIGVELKMLNNSLSATVEAFKKVTHDMLFEKTYPYYSGYPSWGKIWSNVGEMQATGFDITLGYSNTFNKFNIDITATASHSKMKMNKIEGSDELFGSTQWNGAYISRLVVGDEPGYFYGYKTNGLFQDETEVNSYTNSNGDLLQENASSGDIRFVDNNDDGTIDSNDRVKIGSPYADLTGGLSLNSSYKTLYGTFDMGANFSYSYGNDVFNQLKYYKYDASSQNNLSSDALEKAWHGYGTSNDIPILSHNDLNENYTKFSDFYIEDGSFIRLKSLQIGYSLPENICNTLKISKARIYFSGQNLALWTKFTGVDPETSFSTTNNGISGFSYPVQKTYLVGFNLSF